MKKHQLRAILLTFSALGLGVISCTNSDNPMDEGKEQTVVKVSAPEAKGETTNRVKSIYSGETGEVQTQTIPFGEGTITATLTPESASGAFSRSGVSTQNDLQPGIKYKIVVYDSATGAFVTEKDFYSQSYEEQSGVQGLETGKAYTFVAYSINSTSDNPSVSPSGASSFTNAGLTNVSGDLMFFRRDMTLSNGNNFLGIVLKHQYSEITTKLDATGIGNITAVSNVTIYPTNSSANLNFSDNNITYNGQTPGGTPVVFPSLNSSVVYSTPTLLISPLTTTAELNIGSITIAGKTKTNIKMSNVKITPGTRYNLNLNFATPK
ncbi:fimbrillin family protein [Chryseobacterium sp. PMSZPI]|uniref:fimbrillin family protein n=1 Tax=Chryseobacterium sp. PMSZPI TaxID=1033900 RepID=UPI000C34FCAB|nr:fimbrillin family protein [Chryseobacterium sp. PMSZPI]PKF74788.1 hypothetical protein CW752_07485 [Chryseobacterium sp. PMSZPI]